MKWQPTLVSFLGKSHGEQSLKSYCPQGCKDLDTTEPLGVHTHTHTHTHTHIGFIYVK